MNKRRQSSINTKKKLMKASLDLLKEKGFGEINVEEITKRAGVAKGTFYTYFKRKEDIVLESCRAPFTEIAQEFGQMKDTSLIEKLTRYFHRFMECVEYCGINTCRSWIRDVIDPNITPDNKDNKKWAYDFEMLKSMLEFSIQNGELVEDTPVELLTHIIISQLYGMMTCWCMSDGVFEPLDWTDRFCEVQLKNIVEIYLK